MSDLCSIIRFAQGRYGQPDTTVMDGWTQQLGVTQSRISDLMQDKMDKFSLNMPIALATRIGYTVHLTLA